MIFKCPRCGYKNVLNSSSKCEACTYTLTEMQDFLNLDEYLDGLLSKSSIELSSRLIHLYFSDLENSKLIQVKEKFHLENLIEEASTKFYVNVDDNKLDQTTKDIINALIKYDSKMSEIIELFHDKMYYIILNAGQDYLDYDNYIKFLRIYINCLGNIINLKDVNFFFSDEKPDKDNNITLGASATEKTIYLNKAFVSRIYNRKTSCLLLINTIIHELVHSRITNDLSTCQIDKNLNNTVEFCITRACRLLSEFYKYDLYKGDNYRYNYEEANAINDARGYVERLITSLGPLISPKDINSYKEKMYINFRNSNETIYTMNFKDGSTLSVDDFPFDKLPSGKTFLEKRQTNNPTENIRTHEMLDLLIEENPNILILPRYRLLNLIYLNDNGTVRRKTIPELESDINKTNNPYLKDYLTIQIKYLEDKEPQPTR